MANIIKLKRSETAGSVPASGDLEVGEVCMNLVDGILYTKKVDGTVVTVSDKSSGHAELELVSLDTGSSAGPEIDLFRNSFSPFILMVILPVGDNFAFTNNNTPTSNNITNKKTDILLNIVVVFTLNNIILFLYCI